MNRFRAGVLAAVCVAASSSTGRGSRHQPNLEPVRLPDFSSAADSVRTQAHEREDALNRLLATPSAAPDRQAAAFAELGKLLLAGEYERAAEACFRNAQALTTKDGRWPYYLGHVYRKEGQLAAAEASFRRTLTLQPDNIPAMYWLGQALLDLGRPDEASPVFDRALSVEPGSAAILSGIGHVDLARGDYTDAAARFEQILSTDPAADFAHYPLAMAYRGLGQLDEANDHVRHPRASEPGPVDPLMEEVTALLDSAMAYQSRGIEALKRGQAETAATAFHRATVLDPNSATLHHRLGTALFLTGDIAGATGEFQEALRLMPQLARAHYSLGVIDGVDWERCRIRRRVRRGIGRRP